MFRISDFSAHERCTVIGDSRMKNENFLKQDEVLGDLRDWDMFYFNVTPGDMFYFIIVMSRGTRTVRIKIKILGKVTHKNMFYFFIT